MANDIVDLQDLKDGRYDYNETIWKDEVIDPEGDNSQDPTPFTAKRANNFEAGINRSHDRLNDMVEYLEDADRTQKNLRFEFLLLKASVTSGLTSNILVDNFETTDGIELVAGKHDVDAQRVYLP